MPLVKALLKDEISPVKHTARYNVFYFDGFTGSLPSLILAITN